MGRLRAYPCSTAKAKPTETSAVDMMAIVFREVTYAVMQELKANASGL
jgi:hypothetical protein